MGNFSDRVWGDSGDPYQVPEPRDPRGVRHSLTSLLLAAVAALLAGARSFTALGEWFADAPPQVLASLGVRYDPLAGSSRRMRPPSGGSWNRLAPTRPARPWDPGWPGGCRSRTAAWAAGAGRGRQGGARYARRQQRQTGGAPAGGRRSASLHRARPGQGGRQDHEITRFAPLLEDLDLAGCLVTADAMHKRLINTGLSRHRCCTKGRIPRRRA